MPYQSSYVIRLWGLDLATFFWFFVRRINIRRLLCSNSSKALAVFPLSSKLHAGLCCCLWACRCSWGNISPKRKVPWESFQVRLAKSQSAQWLRNNFMFLACATCTGHIYCSWWKVWKHNFFSSSCIPNASLKRLTWKRIWKKYYGARLVLSWS